MTLFGYRGSRRLKRLHHSPQASLQESEAALAKRERYLTALVEVQQQLRVARTEQELYSSVVRMLGEAAAASCVWLFTNQLDNTGRLQMSQQAVWWTPDLAKPDDRGFSAIAYEEVCPRWAAVLSQGQPICGVVTDFPESEQHLLEPYGVRSLLVLPLIVREEFFGLIAFAHCAAPYEWDALDINLLNAAASAIALAYEHRQAEETLRKQADRARLLGTIASRIRQSLDIEEILQRTVAEVQQFLGADRVLIYRFDNEDNGSLVAAAIGGEWGLESAIEVHRVWYRDRQMPYQQGQIYIADNIEQQGLSAEYLHFMQALQVRAKLVVPILQSQHLWGVLTVHQCSLARQWQWFEIDLLEQLATQVAIALQQAQLFQRVQQQAQREQVLNQISRALNSSLDPEHVLQEIVNRTGECFGVDRVVIFTLGAEIKARNEWRANQAVVSMLAFRADISEWSDLAEPDSDFNQHQVFHAPDYQRLPRTNARQFEIEQAQTRSVLAVAIVVRGQPFGALELNTVTETRCFTTEEIQLLQRIADQAAIALYNAQSYEHLEQVIHTRTQELEQEKRLSEAANRAKSEFLATMSHELRTPLHAILGLSDILERQIWGSLNAKQHEYIRHIYSSGEHLLQLINDILDLAKVEAGRETLTLKTVDIHEVCRYCFALVQDEVDRRGLTLTSQIDPAVQTCLADERRLRQMLLNLLSNAVKFTPAGSVSLQIESHPNGIYFTVVDTGIGIAPDKLPLLFQPFSQLDSRLNRQYSGTGLGLVLTRNLARLHGGDVTVESTVGEGSRFQLLLPSRCLDTLAAPTGASTASGSKAIATRCILLIETDDLSATLLQDYLRVSGHWVERLVNLDQLLPRVRACKPNLILLAAQLEPNRNGLDLLQTLRSQPDLDQTPVVIVAATSDRQARETPSQRQIYLSAGANEYLSKPIEASKLESVLMRYF